MWAFVVVLAAPALARAQQGGLFPLAPIRRERVPCPMEDPVYGLHRQQYFGYFPTCWRRFPPGWGCLSPEAPNPAQSYAEIPRDPLPPALPPEEELPARPGEGTPPGGPAMPGEENLPPLPPGTRSPFDIDQPGRSLAPLPGPGGAAPPPTEPEPEPAPAEPAPRRPIQPVPSPPSQPPPGQALAPTPVPTAGVEPPTNPRAESDAAPLLALPDPAPSQSSPPLPVPAPEPPVGPTGLPGPASATGPMPPPPIESQPRAQAPRRPGMLGSLLEVFNRKRQ